MSVADVSKPSGDSRDSVLVLPIKEALAEADEVLATGNVEMALDLWERLRTVHPTHAAPWLRAAAALVKVKRVDEAERLLLDAQAVLPAQISVFHDHARLIQTKCGSVKALPVFQAIKQRFPNDWKSSVLLATCLRNLHRYDDAEAILLQGQREHPGQASFFLDYARVADARNDTAEALARWAGARARFPEHWFGYSSEARVLIQLARHDEAEKILAEATTRFPLEPIPLLEYARVAEAQWLWEEAGQRWRVFEGRFPSRWEGYAGIARSLRHVGRDGDAEACLERGQAAIPDAVQLWFDYARAAGVRSNHEEALRRWRVAQARFPDHWYAHSGVASSLRELRRYHEAETLLLAGVERFPDEPWPLIDLAHMIGRIEPAQRQTGLSDLQSNIDRFIANRGPSAGLLAARAMLARIALDFADYHDQLVAALVRFPRDVQLLREMAVAKELHIEQPFAKPETPPVLISGLPVGNLFDQDVVSHFESLGGDGYGCEFGLVQRATGFESLGLLRWSSIKPANLTRMLEDRMRRIGVPDLFELSVTQGDEWSFLDHSYGVQCNHTHLFRQVVSETDARILLAKRQSYLARKLDEDLEAGDKMLVYRALGAPLDETQIQRLAAAVNGYGPNTLLYVRTAADIASQFTVEWRQPGLMIGYLDWFRSGHDSDRANTSGWIKLCRAALMLWRESRSDDVVAIDSENTK